MHFTMVDYRCTQQPGGIREPQPITPYEVDGAVSVADAARRSGLSTTGARQSLEVLERLGVVLRIGSGRTQIYGPTPGNPYTDLLLRLFETERRQFDDLLQALKTAVALPEIREAWIRDFPVDTPQALEIDVVAEARASPGWEANFGPD